VEQKILLFLIEKVLFYKKMTFLSPIFSVTFFAMSQLPKDAVNQKIT